MSTNLNRINGLGSSSYVNSENAVEESKTSAKATAPLQSTMTNNTAFVGHSENPSLAKSTHTEIDTEALAAFADSLSTTAIGSLGASMMALCVTFGADMRRHQAQQRSLETQSIIEQLKDQANSLSSKSSSQLGIGLAFGIAGCLMGAVSAGITVQGTASVNSAVGNAARDVEEAAQEAMKSVKAEISKLSARTQVVQAFNSSVSTGGNSILGSQTAAADALIKYEDAHIEEIRSMVDRRKNLEDSLKELIQKAIATQQAIADNVNHTRSKILG